MPIDTVFAGISALCAVVNLLRRQEAGCQNTQLLAALDQIDLRLAAIGRQLEGVDRTVPPPIAVVRRFNAVVNTVRMRPGFRRHLIFRKRRDGTWVVSLKPKASILRDPRGEYALEAGANEEPRRALDPRFIKVDPFGQLYRASDSLLPECRSGCRCKDQIDVREVIALTHLKELLESRQLRKRKKPLRWLDLCCGKGSILHHLPSALAGLCKHLEYCGVDIEPDHIRICKATAKKDGLKGQLAGISFVTHDVRRPLEASLGAFDFVTLLNVLHEIEPRHLYNVLAFAVRRCAPHGKLLLIDMAQLPHLEWNAICWPKGHLERLISPLFRVGHSAVASSDPTHVVTFNRSVEIVSLTMRKRALNKATLQPVSTAARKRFQQNVRKTLKAMQAEASNAIQDTYDRAQDPTKELKSPPDLRQLLWRYWAITEALRNHRLQH
jgi:SAM-dependent methyltransferase